jgi:hypothetical protein
MGFEHPDKMGMLDGKTGARFTLEEFDAGLLIVPIGAEQLDRARQIRGESARGEHLGERASSKRLKDFVVGKPWQGIHHIQEND